MTKTEFMDLYEELSQLNESYDIPYSGYTVINADGGYISKEFKTAKTGRDLWTNDIRHAAVWKPENENEAYKMRQWCYNMYHSDDFYVKYVESNKEEEQQQVLKYIPDLLKAYEQLILTGTNFQKLCKQSDFENYLYTKADYDKKKRVIPLFIACINKTDEVSELLDKFWNEVIKTSGLEKTDKDLIDRANKFANSWNDLMNIVRGIPRSYIPIIAEHLADLDKK